MKAVCCLILLGLALLTACDQSQPLVTDKTGIQGSPLKDYETARKVFWRDVYSGEVTSLYCGERFSSRKRRGYNVEHVFPMSWAAKSLKCGKRKQCRKRSAQFNLIEADMHNLYPARSDVNHERSSYRFGLVGGERRQFGRCDFEVDYRSRVAEPAMSVRGDVARAMFYMALRYKDQGLKLFDKQARLLLTWHESDPPNQEERRRNKAIFKIQNNRNPFIDDPELLSDLYKKGAFR